MGKAAGSCERVPDDRLHVPLIDANDFGEAVGTLRFVIRRPLLPLPLIKSNPIILRQHV